MIGKKISVIGTSGSGKTTFAKELSSILRVPHIELDALNWMPNWQARPIDEFRAVVKDALTQDAWVVDGNYGNGQQPIAWQYADTIVWFDYPLWIPLWRVTRRTFVRVLTQTELWNGNRERWSNFFTKDNMIRWVLLTHRRRHREYTQLLAQPANHHLQVIRFSQPHHVDRWLRTLKSSFETH